jgi:hypothetical protein
MKPVIQLFEMTKLEARKIIFEQPLQDYDLKMKGVRKLNTFFGFKTSKIKYSKLKDLGNDKPDSTSTMSSYVIDESYGCEDETTDEEQIFCDEEKIFCDE